jgi:uncharacterized protein (TIGR02996 family)
MSDEAALLRAIATNPDEDTPRLAYADWLDENQPNRPTKKRGKPARVAAENPRAEFIRGQIELAQLKEDSPHRREVAFRCRQLLNAHEEQWLDPYEGFEFEWSWSRGFVERYAMSPYSLQTEAALFEMHPFRRLWARNLEGDTEPLGLIPVENRLTALDLLGNNLTVRHLKKIANLPHLPRLRELGLMFNDLRDTSVKVLCGEPFFQRLDLIRLGANPFTDRGREQLRAHFGDRVTFAHEREPDRLYRIQDEYLRVGWGNELTQFVLLAGEERQRLAVFDHAGNLLRTEERDVAHEPGADATTRRRAREATRDAWLAELGYESATIRVKAFLFPNGAGITPFNWWADVYDGRERGRRPAEMRDSVAYWLAQGKFRFGFGDWGDIWLNRAGEVTDT